MKILPAFYRFLLQYGGSIGDNAGDTLYVYNYTNTTLEIGAGRPQQREGRLMSDAYIYCYITYLSKPAYGQGYKLHLTVLT